MSFTEETVQCGPIKTTVSLHDGLIASLVLPLTPEQWVDVANGEGEHLGACCSEISDARDLLITALRKGGTISSSDFRELCETLARHSGFERLAVDADAWPAEAKTWCITGPDDPFRTIGELWFGLRERLKPPREPVPPVCDPNVFEDAVQIAGQGLLRLDFHNLFTPAKDMGACARAHEMLVAMRILPAIRTIHAQLAEKVPQAFDGYAVVESATGQVIGQGEPLIFDDMAALLRFVGPGFVRYPGRMEVRRCRVSLANGVVLGETMPPGARPEEAPGRKVRLIERTPPIVGEDADRLLEQLEHVPPPEEIERRLAVAKERLAEVTRPKYTRLVGADRAQLNADVAAQQAASVGDVEAEEPVQSE